MAEFSAVISEIDNSKAFFSSFIELISAERSCWEVSTGIILELKSSFSMNFNKSGFAKAYAAVTEAAAAAAAGDCKILGCKESLGLTLKANTYTQRDTPKLMVS